MELLASGAELAQKSRLDKNCAKFARTVLGGERPRAVIVAILFLLEMCVCGHQNGSRRLRRSACTWS